MAYPALTKFDEKLQNQHNQHVFDVLKNLRLAAGAKTFPEAAGFVSESFYLLELVGAVRLDEPELGEMLSAIDDAGSALVQLAPSRSASELRKGCEAAYGIVTRWGGYEAEREEVAETLVDDHAEVRILRNVLHSAVLRHEIAERAFARRIARIVDLAAYRVRRVDPS